MGIKSRLMAEERFDQDKINKIFIKTLNINYAGR